MYENGTFPPNGNLNTPNTGKTSQEKEYKPIKFKSFPGLTPSPSEWDSLNKDDADWKTFKNERWETPEKQSYASAFDRIFRIHASNHFSRLKQHHPLDNAHTKNRESITTFVHLFALPIFKIVAANWARLIVRRSFDLDLLEWRPKERMNSRTIDEIKSRRVAITRHQRDLFASVEILRALMLEEQEREIGGDSSQATHRHLWAESAPEWNEGRGNGVMADVTRNESWERMYWDFFELMTSMDALQKRADKIIDSMVGQIAVSDKENAGRLSTAVVLF
jgi:hypothetical protein